MIFKTYALWTISKSKLVFKVFINLLKSHTFMSNFEYIGYYFKD